MSSLLIWFQSQRQKLQQVAEVFDDWLWAEDGWEWGTGDTVQWTTNNLILIESDTVNWDSGTIITY